MAKTSAEWSEQICSALANLDPQISTEIGDPIRKVIDACSSVAAAIDVNSQVNMSFFDLDSKTGADLDARCRNNILGLKLDDFHLSLGILFHVCTHLLLQKISM